MDADDGEAQPSGGDDFAALIAAHFEKDDPVPSPPPPPSAERDGGKASETVTVKNGQIRLAEAFSRFPGALLVPARS